MKFHLDTSSPNYDKSRGEQIAINCATTKASDNTIFRKYRFVSSKILIFVNRLKLFLFPFLEQWIIKFLLIIMSADFIRVAMRLDTAKIVKKFNATTFCRISRV